MLPLVIDLADERTVLVITLWVMAAWLKDVWDRFPHLAITSPEKRCGKSRLLDLIEALSHQPILTANASPSAVYRSIGAHPSDPPTLLIDEADRFVRKEAETDFV